MTTIYLLSYLTPAKPLKGTVCNGCGLCCHKEICAAGKIFFNLIDKDAVVAPCPLMEFTNGKVRCGLVVAEQRLGLVPLTAQQLGIGKGCDADDSEHC